MSAPMVHAPTRGRAWKRLTIAWAFLLPNFAGFLVFTAGPVLFSLSMAFTDWSLVRHNELTQWPVKFIGFENFRRLLFGDESRLFWDAFYNTAYLMLGIPIGIAGSLLVALLLSRPVGPRRPQHRWALAAAALFVALAAAGAMHLITHPGPAPAVESVVQRPDAVDGLLSPDAALAVHAIQIRRSHAVVAGALILGGVVACGLGAGVVFFRTLFYLPSLLAGIALYLLWKSLYKPTGGAINVALQPLCDTLGRWATAPNLPPPFWHSLGYGAWALFGAVSLWMLLIVARKVHEGDFGVGATLGAVLAVATVAAIGLGLGYWLCQLPPVSRFPTGYEALSASKLQAILADLASSGLFPDAERLRLEVGLYLERGVQPELLIESLRELVPDAQAAAHVNDLVLAHAHPVHHGLAYDGIHPPRWLQDEAWAKPALILMSVWTAIGGANMLLYLAGLSNIPEELYEAAAIDGASPWSRFWNVTWPQLAPTTFFIVIMSTIGGLQGGFDQARAMTEGKYGTEVLTYYLYKLAFTDEFQLGLASAVAWIMFVAIFAMTVVNYRFGSRWVDE